MNAYDIAREERIAALGNLVKAAHEAGDREEVRRVFSEFQAAALARSPEQVAAMEERLMGICLEADHGR